MPGRDPNHWLHRLTAEEWLRGGVRELASAKAAFASKSSRPGLASARRAAGMGWNAVLALDEEPDARFGRSYVDHLVAIADGASPPPSDATPIPEEVREAARKLMSDPAARKSDVISIMTPKRDEGLVSAAETILAEAYARVLRRRG